MLQVGPALAPPVQSPAPARQAPPAPSPQQAPAPAQPPAPSTASSVATQSTGSAEIPPNQLSFPTTRASAPSTPSRLSFADRLNQLSPEQQAAWKQVDPHNLSQVEGFLNQTQLPMPARAQFVQSYLQENYSHQGDVNWNGATLDQAIAGAPRDADGKPGLDCEAFTAIGRRLLGNEGYTSLAVSTTGPDQPRDHQVGLLRRDGDAYLISNQQVVRFRGQADSSNEAILAKAKLSNPLEDPNGDLEYDTAFYSPGQIHRDEAAGMDIEILAVRSATSMDVRISSGPESGYHARQDIDPRNGNPSFTITPKAGDILPLEDKDMVMTSDTEGFVRFPDGREGDRYRVSVSDSGELEFNPLEAGGS